ncbi:acyl carrier protein [Vagococcus fessus]|uniref:Acyl carrier protein n=1 Tax=Vagococcus fessus TaxID=120370 RepID=A0A430AC19_9ENTE|nr:acyl carrier protein [Vagococcus fessus]RSU04728.1 acyl carrier protein [Vagococcus fessus]
MSSFNKIQEIIVDQLGKEESDVTLTTSFKEGLEADSLDVFQIINDIEDEFDVKFESDDDFSTVGDVVNFVDAQLKTK